MCTRPMQVAPCPGRMGARCWRGALASHAADRTTFRHMPPGLTATGTHRSLRLVATQPIEAVGHDLADCERSTRRSSVCACRSLRQPLAAYGCRECLLTDRWDLNVSCAKQHGCADRQSPTCFTDLDPGRNGTDHSKAASINVILCGHLPGADVGQSTRRLAIDCDRVVGPFGTHDQIVSRSVKNNVRHEFTDDQFAVRDERLRCAVQLEVFTHGASCAASGGVVATDTSRSGQRGWARCATSQLIGAGRPSPSRPSAGPSMSSSRVADPGVMSVDPPADLRHNRTPDGCDCASPRPDLSRPKVV